jgi:hypothetical protein
MITPWGTVPLCCRDSETDGKGKAFFFAYYCGYLYHLFLVGRIVRQDGSLLAGLSLEPAPGRGRFQFLRRRGIK